MSSSPKAFIGALHNFKIDDQLKKCSLFFDSIVVKTTDTLMDQLCEESPETAGWLRSQDHLEGIDPLEFMDGDVFHWQTELFRRAIDDKQSGGFVDQGEWVQVLGRPFERETGTNAVVPDGLLAQLRKQKLAVLPGEVIPVRRREERARVVHPSEDDLSGRVGRLTEYGVLGSYFYGDARSREAQQESLRQFRDLVDDDGGLRGTEAHVVLLHPSLAALQDAILATAAPAVGARRSEVWFPVRPDRNRRQDGDPAIEMLHRVLSIGVAAAPRATVGRIVASDLELLHLDVSRTSLADIIEFRERERDALNEYLLGLMALVGALTTLQLADEEFDALLADRCAELSDAAQALRSRTRRHFVVRGGNLAVGLAGFGWFAHSGAVDAGFAALLPALVAAVPSVSEPNNRYTYLLGLSQL